MHEVALGFFKLCEQAAGWEAMRAFCTEGASFSAQAEVLEGVETMEAYCAWTQAFLAPTSGAYHEMIGLAVDEGRDVAMVFAILHAWIDDPEGQSAQRRLSGHYVYAIEFEGDKIRHVTKVWNDVFSLKQLSLAAPDVAPSG